MFIATPIAQSGSNSCNRWDPHNTRQHIRSRSPEGDKMV
jgi:hypothetical protein